MSYISAEFWAFYLLVIVVFWIAARSGRAAVLVGGLAAVSLVFYAAASSVHLLILLGVAAMGWGVGLFLGEVGDQKQARKWLIISLVLILLPLALFKYAGYWAEEGGLWTGSVILLPLGISFFSFQNVSYVVDRWRGLVPAERSPVRYLAYISFFPQLVAGPIVTAKQFLPQLDGLGSGADVRGAVWFILSGCFKKAVLADRLAGVVDPVFANPAEFGAGALALATVGYSLQIYCDFSGYSDIAIGLGKSFGIELPENFRFPYSAASFQDFWRRWHITLSTWLRDYLYIPLGGSRNGQARMFLALLATMLLGGLWHGAHWNFLLWGLGHGVLLCLERWLPRGFRDVGFLRVVWRCVVLVSVVLLWVPFRTGSEGGFAATLVIYERLFFPGAVAGGPVSEGLWRTVGLGVAALGLATWCAETLRGQALRAPAPVFAMIAALVLFVILLASPGGTGFIYFVF